MKRVAFYTLGCKLNYAETSSISRNFENHGFHKVDFTDHPDIFVINTCSVTDHADKKCRKVVNEAKKVNPNAFVAIVGCYAQLKPKEISEIPGVDAVLGAAEKFRIVEVLKDFTKPDAPIVHHGDVYDVNQFDPAYSLQDRTRTFLKVQDGCNYNCAFCTIPLARGASRSLTVDSVVQSAKEIAAKEVREVVLTGVNIGDFGIIDGRRKERLIDLLKALDGVEGITRYRISSIEPNLLTEEIISFVSKSKRFVPHFHIPLQSGNDKILKLMRRRYDTSLYAERVWKIKDILPDACIGVDVITGFPGESHEDFLKTYEYIVQLPVSYLHIFTYSEREHTPATLLGDKVLQRERHERTKMLRILSEKKKREFYTSQIGKVGSVLFEKEQEGSKMFGFTENYVRVEAKYDPLIVNEIKKIRLSEISSECNILAEEIEEEIFIHSS